MLVFQTQHWKLWFFSVPSIRQLTTLNFFSRFSDKMLLPNYAALSLHYLLQILFKSLEISLFGHEMRKVTVFSRTHCTYGCFATSRNVTLSLNDQHLMGNFSIPALAGGTRSNPVMPGLDAANTVIKGLRNATGIPGLQSLYLGYLSRCLSFITFWHFCRMKSVKPISYSEEETKWDTNLFIWKTQPAIEQVCHIGYYLAMVPCCADRHTAKLAQAGACCHLTNSLT